MGRFPRWVGYLNIWVGLMFSPGTFCVFFRTGPLAAWTGLFCFWLPFAAFFTWLLVMTWTLRRAIDHEIVEARACAEFESDRESRLGEMADQIGRLNGQVHAMNERLTRIEGQTAHR